MTMLELFCGWGDDESGVELVMDGWRDKKEGNKWGTTTNWQPKQNKNGTTYSTTGYGVWVISTNQGIVPHVNFLVLGFFGASFDIGHKQSAPEETTNMMFWHM
jgi:hypothetical protein